MADDPHGNGDITDDRRSDPSGTEPGAGTRDRSDDVESNDEWGATDPDDRPTVGGPDGGRDDDRDRIPLDLSGSNDDASDGDDEEDEYAPEASSTPIEPGDPDLENALFVVLGAIAMVLVLARLLVVPL